MRYSPAPSDLTVYRIDGGWRSETENFMNCNTTWGELMYRLMAVAEGKSRGPLFLANELGY